MQDSFNPELFCPVHEVVYELKFIPSVPPDAVFGIIYSRIQELFTNFVPLPVLQAPEKQRNTDPG
ncbi:MAG: hypothetical protein LBR47_07580, partial [Spirochaetaceae bacterium]|nr:hypothetical protein [Spirochaetaceae bacterium]